MMGMKAKTKALEGQIFAAQQAMEEMAFDLKSARSEAKRTKQEMQVLKEEMKSMQVCKHAACLTHVYLPPFRSDPNSVI